MTTRGARIFLGRSISVLTGVLSLAAILKFCLRFFTGRLALYNYSSRPGLHLSFLLAGSLILVAGSFLLWRMKRAALVFFLFQLMMSIFTTSYFGLFRPDARMSSFQHSLMFLPAVGLVAAFSLVRFLAVWWSLQPYSASPSGRRL